MADRELMSKNGGRPSPGDAQGARMTDQVDRPTQNSSPADDLTPSANDPALAGEQQLTAAESPIIGSSEPLAISVAEDTPPVAGAGMNTVGRPRIGDRVFNLFASGASVGVILIVVLVAAFLLIKSVPSIAKDKSNFLTSTDWSLTPGDLHFGIAPLLYTTVAISLMALLIAVPIAIGIALFITQYAPARIAKPVAYVIDLLAAIPSIIYGIWGVVILAPHLSGVQDFLAHIGLGLFSDEGLAKGTVFDGGIVLAIMILPIITAISRDVFARTPRANIEASLALGATKWEMIRMSVIPYGRAGVVSGAMLGLGRALGETIAIAIIVGKVSNFSPSLFSGGETFASKIANGAAEFNNAETTGAYIAAGLVLFVLTFVVNAAARAIVSGTPGQKRLPMLSLEHTRIRAGVAVIGAALVALSFTSIDWFSGVSMRGVHRSITASNSTFFLSDAYFSWLGWALLVLTAAAVGATYLGNAPAYLRTVARALAVVTIVVSVWSLKISSNQSWTFWSSKSALGIWFAIVGFVVLAIGAAPGVSTGGGTVKESSGPLIPRKLVNSAATSLVTLSFLIALVPLIWLLYTVVSKGASDVLHAEWWTGSQRNITFTDSGGGALHAIIGTLEQVALCTIISVPLAVLVGIYLVEYGRGPLARATTFMVDIMTGIPSIVAALFIYALCVSALNLNKGGWLVSLALVILMVPVIVRTTEEMLKLVPNELREASYALGVPKWKTIVKVVLPTAFSGLVTGIVLGIARVAGETAPLLILVGYAPGYVNSLFQQSQAALPTLIRDQFQNLANATGGVTYHLDANGNRVAGSTANFAGDRMWAAALTLILIVLVLNVIARFIARNNKVTQ